MAKSTSSTSKQKEGGKAAAVKVKVGKTAAANKTKKFKITHPIPKLWPVSSRLSYPPPNNHSTTDDDNSVNEKQATSLKPGKTLQQNCNGCDVFLRKSAVQSTSASIVPTQQNSHCKKGALKRFLIVFPGRMTLKAPPAAAVAKEQDTKNEMNAGDNDLQTNDSTTNSNTDNNKDGATKPTKRNPFAPVNPPQLLGRLVSLGGAQQKVELRIPFPSDTTSANDGNDDNTDDAKPQQNQMVMSGRAIPLAGKYMVLSFKRTGGKDSNAAASTPKQKKMGTGSIACKDIFRSLIVLGESQFLDKDKKKVDVTTSTICGSDEVRPPSHYGGSERTVDGGGKNDGTAATTAAAKRKFKSVTAPTPSKHTHDGDESSVVDSDDSNDDEEDDDDIEMKDVNSDDEFVPVSAKKRRSTSTSKQKKSSDSEEDTPVARKRTPRRSAAKATKVKYVDDDSDVDISDDDDSATKSDDDSGKSPIVTQEIDCDSDVSSVVEEIVPKKKSKDAAPASKKRKLSGGSSRNGDVDDSCCIVIDSDDDDVKAPKQPRKNGLKKAAGSKGSASNGKAKAAQAAPSSPLKSVSPRRRKKASPKKPSPKKALSLDLDDDPFAFL
ncbi:hypothetical protein ACHAWT_002019 [Skeletonema menzelii]